MTPGRRQELVALRRARDAMDRRFAEPLDVAAVARVAHMSPAHFSRRFRAVHGETPHAYLASRRIERACALLDAGVPVTEVCTSTGWSSLGSFSSRFRAVVGVPPSAHRAPGMRSLPACAVRALGRRSPGTPREAGPAAAA